MSRFCPEHGRIEGRSCQGCADARAEARDARVYARARRGHIRANRTGDTEAARRFAERSRAIAARWRWST